MALLWFTSVPLGIPGEWTWERVTPEPDLLWNLSGAVVAACLFIGFVRQGWRRFEFFSGQGFQAFEIGLWLVGLIVFSFAWLWIVQEISPARNRLGKSAFVLYYASSSGYFTRARYGEPDITAFLAGYEGLMREGDVLHTGTHPPGLFVAFYGMIAACESSSKLCTFLDETQPLSFREALDVIASNGLRRRVARPILPLDRRVLWLATLLVMASASLTVVPLFGLLRRYCSIQTAWVGAALWPALPAVAVFIPKSDVVFPLIGMTLLWLWLTAWDRRSVFLASLAGTVAWIGLNCSLAFLPVLLLAAVMSLGKVFLHRESTNNTMDKRPQDGPSIVSSSLKHVLCIVSAITCFLLLIFVVRHFLQVNLFHVWRLNYQNHAGFYQQFSRTYWKWLVINPVEVSFAAGWPVVAMAAGTCWNLFRRSFQRRPDEKDLLAWSVAGVWGLLWLTGKNSGEAARLWIVLLPWLICLAGLRLASTREQDMTIKESRKPMERDILVFLAMQFLVCLLTVARVSGFSSESGNAG